MMISIETPVGEIARNYFQTVQVFDQYHIDFCCGGGQSLKDVCKEKSIQESWILKQLEESITKDDTTTQFNTMSANDLIDYIISKHHSFVRENIPLLIKLLDKIEEVHGDRHPELKEINALFKESAGQLTMHMQKEELILFPLAKKLMYLNNENKQIDIGNGSSVNQPIEAMVREHENEGARFEKISSLTKNYIVPDDACNTYRAAYETLHAFEKDLHRHIHLENNILFPMAAKLEQEVMKKS
ncbi:iron-sulfur cluster repair di-iron protein [Sunxiuqinia sp. A32]|uniref:iron-sulfur cluster repair di-iron protein n=1 Tax=Sunxiuqinia sp. A32 TaxID=3461496 RepID=UPI004045FB7B